MPKPYIEFPSNPNIDTEHYFYMFEFYDPGTLQISNSSNTENSGIRGLGQQAGEFVADLSTAFEYNLNREQLKTQIKLPIQSSVKEESSASFNEQSFAGATQISALTGLLSGTNTIQDVIQSAVSDLAGNAGEGSVLGETTELTLRSQRLASNEFNEIVFKGPQRRSYSFDWTLVARNEQDALNMKDIKRAFQYHMHPTQVSFGFFGYPNVVKFKLIESLFLNTDTESEQNVSNRGTTRKEDTIISSETIFQSKICVIESVNVEYGDDKLKFFANDRVSLPGIMKISVSLKEVEYRLREEFDDEREN